MDMDNRLVVTLGEGEEEDVDGVKAVKYMVTERNLTTGGEPTV